MNAKIAKLQKPHGIHGEMKVEFYIKNPRLIANKTLYITENECKIQTIRPFLKNIFLVKFENINTPEDAKTLTNQEIFCKRDELKENKNDLLLCEIIGFSIILDGNIVGIVEQIVNYGSGEAFEFTYQNGKKQESIVHLASEAEYDEHKKEVYINYL